MVVRPLMLACPWYFTSRFSALHSFVFWDYFVDLGPPCDLLCGLYWFMPSTRIPLRLWPGQRGLAVYGKRWCIVFQSSNSFLCFRIWASALDGYPSLSFVEWAPLAHGSPQGQQGLWPQGLWPGQRGFATKNERWCIFFRSFNSFL